MKFDIVIQQVKVLPE